MKKLAVVIVFSFFSSLFARGNFPGIKDSSSSYSVQFTGGFLYPMGSSDGLSSSVQFNYTVSKILTLYINAGYSVWDKQYIIIRNMFENPYIKDPFDFPGHAVHYEEDHYIIPCFLGSRINFNSVPLFTTFIDLELGYLYKNFSKNDFQIIKSFDEMGNQKHWVEYSNKRRVNENLFGIGFGLGLSHTMTKKVDLLIGFKLNTYVGPGYFGLFSTEGTYKIYYAGFNFNI